MRDRASSGRSDAPTSAHHQAAVSSAYPVTCPACGATITHHAQLGAGGGWAEK